MAKTQVECYEETFQGRRGPVKTMVFDDGSKWPLKMGARKLRMVVDHLTEVREFLARNPDEEDDEKEEKTNRVPLGKGKLSSRRKG